MELPDLFVLLLQLTFQHTQHGAVGGAVYFGCLVLMSAQLFHDLGNDLVLDSPLPTREVCRKLPRADLSPHCGWVHTQMGRRLRYAVRHRPPPYALAVAQRKRCYRRCSSEIFTG